MRSRMSLGRKKEKERERRRETKRERHWAEKGIQFVRQLRELAASKKAIVVSYGDEVVSWTHPTDPYVQNTPQCR